MFSKHSPVHHLAPKTKNIFFHSLHYMRRALYLTTASFHSNPYPSFHSCIQNDVMMVLFSLSCFYNKLSYILQADIKQYAIMLPRLWDFSLKYCRTLRGSSKKTTVSETQVGKHWSRGRNKIFVLLPGEQAGCLQRVSKSSKY